MRDSFGNAYQEYFLSESSSISINTLHDKCRVAQTYGIYDDTAASDGDVSNLRSRCPSNDVINVKDQLRYDVNTDGCKEVDVNTRAVTSQSAETKRLT